MYNTPYFIGQLSFQLTGKGSSVVFEIKSHLVRKESLNVLPSKPGVGQYIAIHATLTARDFFLAYFYSFGPFSRGERCLLLTIKKITRSEVVLRGVYCTYINA